ncbi:MAG: SUF system NifU family Fe-S cluster assembly protein [Deltaproteobacteria bacterium]|nr:SUF system NifU family Fe-S cluster assembly protein [Deltaproteobacteria bacterium]
MNDLKDLYQEVILDHNKRPRNFCKLQQANHHAEGYNPLCGDHIDIYLQMEGDLIKDISFEGSGCAISKASASLMTDTLKGKTREKAETLFDGFHQMVTGGTGPAGKEIPQEMGKLAVFSGVREFPARVKCASLAWHTFHAALENRHEAVSTEEEDLNGKPAQQS